MGNMFGSFKNNKDVPIIGQAFKLKAFFPTLLIQCNCADKEPVMLVGNGPGQCPACKRVFVLQGIKSNEQGELSFAVGLAVQPQPEPVGVPS